LAAEAIEGGAQLLGVGEMGIGNSTAAAALLSACSGIAPEELAGSGTGVDEATRRKKAEIIHRALAVNRPDPADPLGVLAKVGATRSPELSARASPARRGACWWWSTGSSPRRVPGWRVRSTPGSKTV